MAFFTRLILAIFGMAFAALFAVGVLFWLAFYLTFASLRWLVTGQKPQVVMMWQQIQALRKGTLARERPWPEDKRHTERWEANTDVVQDVVVRDVTDKRQLPKN